MGAMPKMTATWLAALLMPAGVLVACITPSEKRQLHDDVFNVQTRLLNLERLLVDTSKESKASGESATKRIATNQAELDRLGREIQQLHGDVDALRVGVVTGQMPGIDPAQQENSLATTIAKLGERLEAIEQSQEELIEALHKAGLKSGKKKDSRKTIASVSEMQQAFDAQHYKQVVDEASHVLKGLEGGERDHARYLLAESFYKLGKLREAALRFNDLMEGKPDAKWMAPAKMRIGDCFRRLGDTATAKVYYEELIKDFPRSDEAVKAKERLAEASKPEGRKQ